MTPFGPQIVDQVRTACEGGAVMAGIAFGETLGKEVTIEVGRFQTLDLQELPAEFDAASIVLVLEQENGAALIVVPANSPLLPEWCQDAEEVKKRFEPLARQMQVLMPPDFTSSGGWAARVEQTANAVRNAGIRDGGACQELLLKSNDQSTTLWMLWPCRHPETLTRTQVSKSLQSPTKPRSREMPRLQYHDLEDGLRLLPDYVRSLLRIRVPVSVTLASAKQSVRKILDLGPGSIIQFRKSCEETLTLEVGNQTIAEGEAVKVGDKFGLWITGITLPKERFHKLLAHVTGSDSAANVHMPRD